MVFSRGFNGIGSIAPICLANEGEEYQGQGFIAGWGDTQADQNKGSEDLLFIKLNILPHTSCSDYHQYRTNIMLCGGYDEGGKDACQVS